MARITVEDCLISVPNSFELVLLAAHRARDLRVRASPTVPWDKDKRAVIALRELAAGTLDPAEVRETLITNLQIYGDQDEVPAEEAAPAALRSIVIGAPAANDPGYAATLAEA